MFDATSERHLQQNRMDGPDREPRRAGDLIHIDGRRPQSRLHAGAIVLGHDGWRLRRLRLTNKNLRRPHHCALRPYARDWLKSAEDVRGLGHNVRTVLDEAVCTLCPRIEGVARNGKDLPALVGSETRRDQGPGASRRLDDDDAEREAGDNAVSAGKILATRLEARRLLGNEAALASDQSLQ